MTDDPSTPKIFISYRRADSAEQRRLDDLKDFVQPKK